MKLVDRAPEVLECRNWDPAKTESADLVARVVNAASSIADALGSVVLAVPAGLNGNRPEGALSPPKQVSGPSAAAARPLSCGGHRPERQNLTSTEIPSKMVRHRLPRRVGD